VSFTTASHFQNHYFYEKLSAISGKWNALIFHQGNQPHGSVEILGRFRTTFSDDNESA
jgi:hypothetical protein